MIYLTEALRNQIETTIGKKFHRSEWRCSFDSCLCLKSWGGEPEVYEFKATRVFDGLYISDLGAGGHILPEVYALEATDWNLNELLKFLRQEHDLAPLANI